MPSRGNYIPEYQDARYDQYQPQETSRYTKADYKQNQRRRDPPPYYTEPNRYGGFDQGRYPPQETQYQQPPRVGFDSRASQKETFSTVQRSKNRTKIVMLVILIIFLAAATAMGGVSTRMSPWWKRSRENENFDWVEVGLWESCYKTSKEASWNCHTYNDTSGHKPSYEHLELIQILMIAGTGCSGLTFIFTMVAVFATKTKMFRALLYTIAFLSAAGAALFGTVIGYITDQKKGDVWLSQQILTATSNDRNSELDFALMFFLACAAAGSVFLALVFSVVILFISDDYDLDELDEDEMENPDYNEPTMGNGVYPGHPYQEQEYSTTDYNRARPPHQTRQPYPQDQGRMYPQEYDERPRKHKSRHHHHSDRNAYRNPAFQEAYPPSGPAVVSREFDPFPPTSGHPADSHYNPYKAYSVHSTRATSKHHQHHRSHKPRGDRNDRDHRHYYGGGGGGGSRHSKSTVGRHQYDDYEVYFNSPY